MLREQADALGVGIGKAGTYGGGGAAIVSGLTLHEWGIAVGIAVAVLGFVTQVFFNRRRDRREHEYHVARMYGLTGYKGQGDGESE